MNILETQQNLRRRGMGEQSMLQQVIQIITFMIVRFRNAKRTEQYTLKDITQSAHYLKIQYLTNVAPIQMGDLFTISAKKANLSNNELSILIQKQSAT